MSNLQKELYRAAVLTFEELGLFLPSPELDDQQRQAAAEGTVTVPFGGPFSGRLVVTICGGVLGGLASNMLGEDEVTEPAQQSDALGEIGNVICGNILPRIAGTKQLFNLRPPSVQLGSSQQGATGGGSPVVTAQVGLDAGRADLALFLDGDATAFLGESPR